MSVLLIMVDVSIIVLIYWEVINVIVIWVIDYLEEIVEVCVILFVVVNLI